MVFLVVQFGPLIRERLSLRRTEISEHKQRIISNVIIEKLNNISESHFLEQTNNSVDDETEQLIHFFAEVCETKWQNITDPNSLAEIVRKEIKAA